MFGFFSSASRGALKRATLIALGQPCKVSRSEGALRKLRKAVQSRNAALLDEQVALSVTINETAAMSVNLAVDLSDVFQESDSIASASVELEATVKDLNSHAAEVVDRAETATQAASSCVNSMRVTTRAMEDINHSVDAARMRVDELLGYSAELGKITKTIGEIAAQTNLLALNATIEAARAGEAGKGFAVVADEVKNLSAQTAQETAVIERLLGSIKTEIEHVEQAMGESSEAVARGNAAVEEVGSAIQELGSSTQATHESMRQVAEVLGSQSQAIAEISENVTAVSRKAERCQESVNAIVDATGDGESIILPFLAELAEQDIPGKIVKLAKSDHVIWKKRLYAMLGGREGLKAEELADCHSCRLGKWYDSVAAEYGPQFKAFRELADPHRVVHEHGIQAVKLYNDGQLDQAIDEVALVEKASREVLRLLDDLEADLLSVAP